jgi:radical SAM family uncharacterized protein/radical SAM-linked protein
MHLFPDHPHAGFLLQVSRPGRYAGSELGTAPLPQNPTVSLALAFPDVYEIGCSNMGLTILYRIASSMPGVRVERAFAPWSDYAARLRELDLRLASFESGTELRRFDILGFSLQHELLYTNVLLMLRAAGLALRSRLRGPEDPLVIAGGPCAGNPEPLAEFVDAFALGDGEELLPEILRQTARAKAAGRKKQALLESLSALRGIYVPALYQRETGAPPRRAVTGGAAPLPVRYARLESLDETPVVDPPIPAMEPVFDRYQIEITRGCCGGCRFCHAGIVYRPIRHRPPGQILAAAVGGILRTGHGALSLSSLSPADYPCLEPLALALKDFLVREKIVLSVSSLRSYGVSERVLETIASVKATGITLAPEAGTQRLRDVLGKRVTDEDLERSMERLARLGWQRVKLYFMMGLPQEHEEDLDGIIDTVRRCRKILGGRRRPELGASVSNFIPKPFTPFQREPMAGQERLRAGRERLRALARGLRVKLDFHNARQSLIESVLARGGSELCDVIEDAFTAGAVMDGWTDCFNFEAWLSAFGRHGLELDSYLTPIPPDAPLPWGHIHAPASDAFLKDELEKAGKGLAGEPCGGSGDHPTCRICGAGCRRGPDPEDATGLVAASRWVTSTLGQRDMDRDRLFARDPVGDRRPALYLKFRRFGRTIYTGHQDMIRVLRHILARANVPLRYSAGFTPRPILQFRAALPLGVIGLNEQALVEVERLPLDPGLLLDRLNEASHPGVEFFQVSTLEHDRVRDMVKALPPVRWLVIPRDPVSKASMEAAAEALGGAPSLTVNRRRGGPSRGDRTPVDLRPMITRCLVQAPDEAPELEGLVHASFILRVDTVPDDGRLVRIEDLEALFEPHGLTPQWYIRWLED